MKRTPLIIGSLLIACSFTSSLAWAESPGMCPLLFDVFTQTNQTFRRAVIYERITDLLADIRDTKDEIQSISQEIRKYEPIINGYKADSVSNPSAGGLQQVRIEGGVRLIRPTQQQPRRLKFIDQLNTYYDRAVAPVPVVDSVVEAQKIVDVYNERHSALLAMIYMLDDYLEVLHTNPENKELFSVLTDLRENADVLNTVIGMNLTEADKGNSIDLRNLRTQIESFRKKSPRDEWSLTLNAADQAIREDREVLVNTFLTPSVQNRSRLQERLKNLKDQLVVVAAQTTREQQSGIEDNQHELAEVLPIKGLPVNAPIDKHYTLSYGPGGVVIRDDKPGVLATTIAFLNGRYVSIASGSKKNPPVVGRVIQISKDQPGSTMISVLTDTGQIQDIEIGSRRLNVWVTVHREKEIDPTAHLEGVHILIRRIQKVAFGLWRTSGLISGQVIKADEGGLEIRLPGPKQDTVFIPYVSTPTEWIQVLSIEP